jgi:hypothetical protein
MEVPLSGDYSKGSALTHAGLRDVSQILVKYKEESEGVQYE